MTTKTPVHLWIIGVISLLWHVFGVMDYAMTHSRNEKYMSVFTESQREFFYNFPLWMEICWAVGIFGGLLGTVLLLFRSRLAAPVFAISLAAFVGTVIYSYLIADGFGILGLPSAIVTAMIFLFAVFLWMYSARMQRAGVLS